MLSVLRNGLCRKSRECTPCAESRPCRGYSQKFEVNTGIQQGSNRASYSVRCPEGLSPKLRSRLLSRWSWHHCWLAGGMCCSWHGKKPWKCGVNARKAKVIICGTDLYLLENVGKFSCAVCHTGVGNSSIYYNVCIFFISANSIKRHISDLKNSRLRQDLPISINDRVILPFREGFILRSFAKIKSSR